MLEQAPLLHALQHYNQQGRRRFHVPAHAGGIACPLWQWGLAQLGLTKAALANDLTEVEGLDELANASGCIAESQQRTAAHLNAKAVFYGVNGASGMLQAALLAAFQPGDTVVLPRNVHRSIVAALVLTGVRPRWVLPSWQNEWGAFAGLTAAQLQQAVESSPTPVTGVVLPSPTYEGFVAELPAIAAYCQAHNLRVIVDEAHGALWPYHSSLWPASALALPAGVDVVVHSLHKTVGCLTQAAQLVVPHTSQLSVARIRQALNHLQTTSPNYLVLASIDWCNAWLRVSQPWLADYWQQSVRLRQALVQTTALRLAPTPDATRLLVCLPGHDPADWATRLEQSHGLAYELTTATSALYCRMPGLTVQDDEAFLAGMQTIASSATRAEHHFPLQETTPATPWLLPELVCTPREAFFSQGELLPAQEALGAVAQETVVACPPGVPVLLPGERIQAEHLPFLPQQLLVTATHSCE